MVIPVKGTIVSSSNKWIYDWLGIQATSPDEIERLLAKAKASNEDMVVVEINSGGGEVFAGFEIYTLIRQYSGNIEIHIVGLAGSAASVIAMATTCKISPVGMIMIHNSSSYAEGDYHEMDASSGMLQAINSSIRLAYKQKSNVEEDELINLMDNETWMNAEDAVAKGFVDGIMFENQDNSITLVAAFKEVVISTSTINKIKKLKAEDRLNEVNPDTILAENEKVNVSNSANESVVNTVHIENENEGGRNMNYAEVVKQYPEIENEINVMLSEAETRGAENERNRLHAIDEIAGSVDSKSVYDATYGDNKITAEQLALQAIKNNKTLGDAYFKNALSDSDDSGVNNVKTEPTDHNAASEDDKLSDIAANAANQKRKVK